MPDRKSNLKTGTDISERILDATEERLITSGYHKLRMRNIASDCKISVGNLTYHFPTKESLIYAVVQRLTDFYLKGFKRTLSGKRFQTGSEVESLIEWLLKDSAKDYTTRLNRELWMLSSHYPKIQREIGDLYHTLTADLADHLSGKFPHLSKHKLEKISCLVAILTEGTCVIYGGRYRVPIKSKEINSTIAKIMTEYIES